jgi:hypothetical protein
VHVWRTQNALSCRDPNPALAAERAELVKLTKALTGAIKQLNVAIAKATRGVISGKDLIAEMAGRKPGQKAGDVLVEMAKGTKPAA